MGWCSADGLRRRLHAGRRRHRLHVYLSLRMAVRRYAASVARQCGLLRAAAMRGTCSGDAARYFAWRRRAADGGCDASDRTAGEHCCVCVGAAAHRTAGAPHLPRRPCTGRHGRGHRGGCGWRRVHAHRPAPPVPGASPAATTCESAALHMPGILFRGMPTHTVPVCARSTRYITNAHSLEQSPSPRSWPTPRRCRVCPPPPRRGGCRCWRRRMPWRRRARGTDRASCSCSALLQQAMPASSLAEAQGGVQGAGEGVGGQGAGQIREGAKRLSTIASLCDHAGPACMFRSTWSSSISLRVYWIPSQTIGFPWSSSGHGLPFMSTGFSSFCRTACCHWCTKAPAGGGVYSRSQGLSPRASTVEGTAPRGCLDKHQRLAHTHRVLLHQAPLHRLAEVFLASVHTGHT